MYDEICFFVKIVELGKFAVAAEKLGIAQSTISRKIAALEEQLNYKLIKRDSRNLELTTQGEDLYNLFKDTLAETQQLVTDAIISDKRYKNVLNLLLPVGMANFGFSRVLAGLPAKLPGIRLNLTYYTGTIDIDKYKFDLAIVSLANKKEFQSAKLVYSSKVIITCSTEYIKNHGLCSTVAELMEHTVVGNVRILEGALIPQLFRESDGSVLQIPTEYKLYLNSFLEAKNLVLSGMVISGLMETDIREEIQSGEIVRLLPDYHVGYMNYYLLSKYEQSDTRYQKVLELLEEFFK